MQDRKKRLVWTVLVIALPGPWTPIIVLAYLLGRVAEDDQYPEHRPSATHYPPPQFDPYLYARRLPEGNPYAPPQLTGSR